MFKRNIFFPLFLLISALVLYPLIFQKGLVFSTDLVFREYPPYFFSPGDNLQLFKPLFWVWSKLFPLHILQKIIFVGIFLLIYAGGYKLFSLFSKDKFVIFTGTTFLIFNPFFYERFVDGAINVYFSYALYPLLFYYLLQMFRRPRSKNFFLFWLVSFFLTGISIYNIGIIFFSLLALSFVFLKRENWKEWLKILSMATGLLVITNLYWIIPTVFEKNKQGVLVLSQITAQDFQTFGPTAMFPANIYFTVASLNGHWGEKFHRYSTLRESDQYWVYFFGLIFAVVLAGIYFGVKNIKLRRFAIGFAFLGAISYFLSLGVNSLLSKKITEILIDGLPFYKGFRETTKFLGILAVMYAIFITIGLARLSYFLKKRYPSHGKLLSKLATGFMLIIILVYSYPLFNGASGQLQAVDYPRDWYDLRQWTKQNITLTDKQDCSLKTQGKVKNCYKIIVLPWHTYQFFKFINRNTINPLPWFFPFKTLGAENLEMNNVFSRSLLPENIAVDKYFQNWNEAGFDSASFISTLRELGIEYILVDKEEDWASYNALFQNNNNFTLLWNTENLILYKIDSKN